GGTSRWRFAQQNALHAKVLCDSVGPGDDAEHRALQSAMPDQVRGDAVDGVHGYRKTDTCVRARRAGNLRVNADEAPGAVQQRAAAIPWIDGGVSLNHVVNGSPCQRGNLASQSADNSSCESVIEPEGISDSEYFLPNQQIRRGADRDGGELGGRRVNLEDG